MPRRMSAREAYDIVGCDGESLADDFIAMELAGYGPEDHGDFLMDALVGATDAAHEAARRRAADRVDVASLHQAFSRAGIGVDERNTGLHWLLFREGKRVAEFWPTKARWRLADGTAGRGLDDLLAELRRAA